jgi:hypothetical protein
VFGLVKRRRVKSARLKDFDPVGGDGLVAVADNMHRHHRRKKSIVLKQDRYSTAVFQRRGWGKVATEASVRASVRASSKASSSNSNIFIFGAVTYALISFFKVCQQGMGDFTAEKYFEIIRSIYSLASLESNPLLFENFLNFLSY